MVAAQEDADVLRSELSRVIDDNRKEQNQRLKARYEQKQAHQEWLHVFHLCRIAVVSRCVATYSILL